MNGNEGTGFYCRLVGCARPTMVFCSLQPRSPQSSSRCATAKPTLIYSARVLSGSRFLLLLDLGIGKCRTAAAQIHDDVAFYDLPKDVARLIARSVGVRV